MLGSLCDINGVSGFEGEVREFILSHIKSGEVTCDALGNVIVYKKGKSSSKKLMCCAHMDEVGMMISEITEKGALKFKCCGGIDSKVLVSKRVTVGERHIPGVIALKAIHLQEKDERAKEPDKKKLFVDIGATSREEAEKYVSVGDCIAFDTKFAYFGDGYMKGKALDDRVGCACLLKLLEKDYDYDFYGVFSVLEEIGGVGAKAAASRIRPDLAIVLEGTTCSDVYGTKPHMQVTRLKGGVCIPVRDKSMIADRKTVDALIKCADENNIKWQYKHTTAGGTDGGAIHLAAGGIRCAIIALPCRYIHSPVGVASVSDYEAYIALAEKFTERALIL